MPTKEDTETTVFGKCAPNYINLIGNYRSKQFNSSVPTGYTSSNVQNNGC